MTSDMNILALRYAFGELPAADAAAFEIQLASDQVAREALADAVLLMAAVRDRPSVPAIVQRESPVSKRRSRAAAFISCAAAALVVVAVLFETRDTQSTAQRRETGEATALVGTWSELGSDVAGFRESEGDFSEGDDSPDVPDWMLAALLDGGEAPPREEGTL